MFFKFLKFILLGPEIKINVVIYWESSMFHLIN